MTNAKMNKFHILAALMVKNEEKRILVSLESVKDSVSGVCLYDTGSTDNTIKIVKDFCTSHNIEFFLLEGQFIDFSVSRNKLFDFIDNMHTHRLKHKSSKNDIVYDYILLLDSNDEYKGKKPLPDILKDEISNIDNTTDSATRLQPHKEKSIPPHKSVCFTKSEMFEGNSHVRFKIKCRKKAQKKQNIDNSTTTDSSEKCAKNDVHIIQKRTPDAFMVKQRWFIGGGRNDLSYFNIKIVKPNIGFKYVEPVHEYISEPPNCVTHKIIDGMEIYQDRVADNDGKSKNRWKNDISILTRVLQETPDSPRTQYYLAQTYDCLENYKQARKYYKIRSQNPQGFWEERFLSMLKCGYLKPSSSITWFYRAYEFMARAEPLIDLAKFFRNKNQFQLSYAFSKMACSLKFPETETLLWSPDKIYNHDRWQELSISAYYVQQFAEGEEACKKALQSVYDKELNAKNLEFYTLHKNKECISGLQKP